MANSRSATLQWFCRFARRPAAALSIPCHPEITAEESYWHWRWKHASINNHRGIRTVFGWNFVEAYQFLLLPLLGRVVSIRYSLLLLMFRGGLCVCQSVFLLVTAVSCAKTEELIKMLFEVWTCVGQTNCVLDGDLIPPGKWAVLGDISRPIVKYRKYLACCRYVLSLIRYVSRNNLVQVVCIHVPLSPSSIIW